MRARFLVVPVGLLLVAGCKRHRTPPPRSDEGPTRQAKATCDAAGRYRFRFRSNNQDGWWFRFAVRDGKATLVDRVPMLELDPGPLELDAAGCRVTVGAHSKWAGDVEVAVTLDPESRRFSGTLSRTKALSEDEKRVAVTGVKGPGPPRPAAPCLVPGLYELALDKKVAWKNEDATDDRDCSYAADLASPIAVRVEPFGDALAITRYDVDPPHEQSGASSEATSRDDCHATLALGRDVLTLEAELTFTPARIEGKATRVSYQIEEDGEEGESVWTCVASGVPLVGTRIR